MVIDRQTWAAMMRNRNARALPIAAALAAAMLVAAPAEWFVRIDRIQIVPTSHGKVVVAEARKLWLLDAMPVSWSARVERIRVPLDGSATGETICRGGGQATIDDDGPGILLIPLPDWVGDPDCEPAAGQLHIARATWSIRLFGLTKTATEQSAAFTPAEAPIRLGSARSVP
jgi:hypothetical protein